MEKILVNYADERFKAARKINSRTGLSLGGFDRVVEYGPADINEGYRTRHADVFSIGRGGGLWLWKPYLIRKACYAANEGDIIFYCDAGAFFIRSANPVFLSFDEQPVWVSDIPLFEEQWTHEDCYKAVGADRPEIRGTQQIQGGFIGMRVCSEAISLIDEWLALCEKPGFLNPGSSVVGSACIAHREDQSALSLLCKKRGVRPHRDPTQYGKLPEKYIGDGRKWKVPSHPEDSYAPFIVLHRSGEMDWNVAIRQYACAMLPRVISLKLIAH